MTNEEKMNHLKIKLAEAVKLCDYWRKRRFGQVRNCISDQEHEDEAWRNLKRIEYAISQLEQA